NPDPYFHLGQAYQGAGKHKEAIEVLQKSIALNPSLNHNDYQVTTAHYRLGQSLLKVGRTAEGEKELQISADLKAKGFKLDEKKRYPRSKTNLKSIRTTLRSSSCSGSAIS